MARERAVLWRSQLNAHRQWLRLGFGDHLDLQNKRYEGQVLVGWTFERGSLRNCAFIGCNMSSANLKATSIRGCTFEGGSLEMAKFHESNVADCDFDQVGALGIFVDNARITGCLFRQGTLATVTWRGAVVTRCRFEGTVLRKSQLLDVRFEDCTFVRCDFTGTDWEGVDVSRASFEDCLNGPPRERCAPIGSFPLNLVDVLGEWTSDNGYEVRIERDAVYLKHADHGNPLVLTDAEVIEEAEKVCFQGVEGGLDISIFVRARESGKLELAWLDEIFPASFSLSRRRD